MKITLKNAFIFILLLVLLYLFRGFIKDTIITSLGGYIEKETKIKTKIEYKKGKIDTLEIFNNYIKTKGIKIGKDSIIYKYKYLEDNTIKIKDSIRENNIKINDSILEGTFTVYNDFKGYVIDSEFNYKPKIPKLLVRTDTIFNTTTITNTLTNNKPLIGIGGGFTSTNNLQHLSLSGSYITKSKWQIIGTYGKSLNNTKTIIQGQEFKINNSDMFGITIIKHW